MSGSKQKVSKNLNKKVLPKFVVALIPAIPIKMIEYKVAKILPINIFIRIDVTWMLKNRDLIRDENSENTFVTEPTIVAKVSRIELRLDNIFIRTSTKPFI